MTDWLDQMVGDWTYEANGSPGDPEHRRTGIEVVIRREAWLVIEGPDYRFQIALDAKTGKATGDFVHWAHPTLWVYEGEIEADGCLHLKSRGPSFDVEGGMADYDDVFEVLSKDERRLTSRVLGPDGQWRDFMTAIYHRKV
jgi:hypothetical protein